MPGKSHEITEEERKEKVIAAIKKEEQTKKDTIRNMEIEDEMRFGEMNKWVKMIARRVEAFEKVDENTIITQGHTVKAEEGDGMISIDGEVMKWTKCKKYISF